MSKKDYSKYNPKIADVVAINFITLKLIGVIDWPWVWVLAPVWIPLTLFIMGLLIVDWINS